MIVQSAAHIVPLQPAFGGWPLLGVLLGLSLLLTLSYVRPAKLAGSLSASTAVAMLLTQVPGVNKIAVSLEKRQTIVNFDDTKIHVEAPNWATQEAGYRSRPQGVSQ